MTATAYADIRRRLAEATGPLDDIAAHDLASAVFRPAFTMEWYLLEAALRGFLDAAIALVEKKLPGTMYVLRGDGPSEFPAVAELVAGTHEINIPLAEYEGATLLLAVLSALFAALDAADD